MKKFKNKCPNCGATRLTPNEVDVYYDRNPVSYKCVFCRTIIVVETINYIKEVKIKNDGTGISKTDKASSS